MHLRPTGMCICTVQYIVDVQKCTEDYAIHVYEYIASGKKHFLLG